MQSKAVGRAYVCTCSCVASPVPCTWSMTDVKPQRDKEQKERRDSPADLTRTTRRHIVIATEVTLPAFVGHDWVVRSNARLLCVGRASGRLVLFLTWEGHFGTPRLLSSKTLRKKPTWHMQTRRHQQATRVLGALQAPRCTVKGRTSTPSRSEFQAGRNNPTHFRLLVRANWSTIQEAQSRVVGSTTDLQEMSSGNFSRLKRGATARVQQAQKTKQKQK